MGLSQGVLVGSFALRLLERGKAIALVRVLHRAWVSGRVQQRR